VTAPARLESFQAYKTVLFDLLVGAAKHRFEHRNALPQLGQYFQFLI